VAELGTRPVPVNLAIRARNQRGQPS